MASRTVPVAVLICVIYLFGLCSASDVVERPFFWPLGSQWGYEDIMQSLSRYSSDLILYPYAFTTSAGDHFPEGAVISIAGGAPNLGYIQGNTSIILSRAMALYDVNVAILDIVVTTGTGNATVITELTYEAYDYCTLFLNYIFNKYPQCWKVSDYLGWSAGNPGAGAQVVFVSEVDIQNGILMIPGTNTPRFGMLIIPDIYQTKQSSIVSLLGPNGTAALTAYANNGGTIFASAKGALVLQDPAIGLIPAGTLDSGSTLMAASYTNAVTGCATPASDTSTTYLDFVTRTLCLSPPTTGAGVVFDSLTSAPLSMNTGSMQVLSYWDVSTGGLTSTDSQGVPTAIPASSATQFAQTLYTQTGKGQVIAHLGNSVWQTSSYGWIMNALFASMARPVILEGYVNSTVANSSATYIPAFEPVVLDIVISMQNLYSDNLPNGNFYVYVANGVEVLSLPSNCVVVNASLTVPDGNTLLQAHSHVDCGNYFSSGTIPAFFSTTFTIKIKIVDTSITAVMNNIVLLYPYVTYIEPARNNLLVVLDNGPIFVDAANAASLTADTNADPMGIYPIAGAGTPVDNVPYVINKMNTQALNVRWISQFPLVTPIVDGNVQTKLLSIIDFDYMYYLKKVNGVAAWKYPMTQIGKETGTFRDLDVFDYYLNGLRGGVSSTDLDTPVKTFTAPRNATYPTIAGLISGYNTLMGTHVVAGSDTLKAYPTWYNTSMAVSDSVTVQDYFSDALNFYETCGGRSLAYLNTATPLGYQMLVDSASYIAGQTSFPPWMMNKAGTAFRTQYVFGRLDAFWYDVQSYVNPEGVTPKTLITVDKYALKPTCTAGVGASKSSPIMVHGYYNSDYYTPDPTIGVLQDWDSPPGMKANEYANGFYSDCDFVTNAIQGANADAATGGLVKYSHYIMRMRDNPEVTDGDDILYMVKDPVLHDWYYAPTTTEGVARFGDYPEVRLQYIWAFDWLISPNQTEVGGKFTITLPAGISFLSDPIANQWITVAADKVAVTNTTWDATNGVITVFFKRGQEPDEYAGAASTMGMNLQWLTGSALPANSMNPLHFFNVQYELYEMNYDISSPSTDFMVYTHLPAFSQSVSFYSTLAWQFPSVTLDHALMRGPYLNESYIQPYESLQPLLRQGTYLQELKSHRTVYSLAEVHPVSDTGIVLSSGGFDYCTSLGISSIPFREFLKTGAAQWIPGTTTTSRIEWTDLWGRPWCEPIRSLFVDIAPLPGPLMNFQMTTTYEILDLNGKRLLQWQSDETVMIRTQVKVRNNYYKYFDITLCNSDMAMSNANGGSVDPAEHNYQALNWGGGDEFYAQCFTDQTSGSAWLGGVPLNQTVKTDIIQVHQCADNGTFYAGCSSIMTGLPIISARPNSDESTWWNFDESTYNFYPTGYIDPNMWDLTCPTYSVSPYLLANPFHMDNVLPNFDTAGQIKPENIISFPILKGLGYEFTYSRHMSSPAFPGLSGWWSDQLQNRDYSLIAGQQTNNKVAVGQPDLTEAVGWIPISELEGVSSIVEQVHSNIYGCLFNRQRVRTDPADTKFSFLSNVVVNNVVPVDPTLYNTINTVEPSLTVFQDPRYDQYECDLTQGMYQPHNISQYYNYLTTNTDQDYLYFAANLRAQALENVNVLAQLAPSSTYQYEGPITTQNGPRFVYWNPGLGPNTFEVVDDQASVVYAKRTDLTVNVISYPVAVATFNSVVMQWIHVEDKNEINRKWEEITYYNFHGYGDSAAYVYVGGSNATTCVLNPGDVTLVDIQLQNNAGFDWRMLVGAMTSVITEMAEWSDQDIMSGTLHSVQIPIAYNFLNLTIPPYLAPYIQIAPSTYFADVAPMQFDFQNINVVSIVDGFRGDYFYNLTLAQTIPDSLRGKLHEINISIVPSFFESLPGYNDPTGIHDYMLTIPNIVFGIPYGPETPEYEGEIFWTSGHANNLVLAHTMDSEFVPQSAQFFDVASTDYLATIATIAGLGVNQSSIFRAFWNNLTAVNRNPVGFWTKAGPAVGTTTVYYNVTQHSSYFPWTNPAPGPAIAKMDILTYAEVGQIPPGWNTVTYAQYTGGTFQDDVNKTKQIVNLGQNQQVHATGPWLTLTYALQLYYLNGQAVVDGSLQYNMAGTGDLTVYVVNTGNNFAYDVVVTLELGPGITLNGGVKNTNFTMISSGSNATINTHSSMAPGAPLTFVVPLAFAALTNGSLSSRLFISAGVSAMDIFPGSDTVQQIIDSPISKPLVAPAANLTGFGSGSNFLLTVDTSHLNQAVTPYTLTYWRRDNIYNGTWFIIKAGTTSANFTDTITQGSFTADYFVTVSPVGQNSVIAATNTVKWSKTAAPWFIALVIALPIAVAALAALIGAVLYARKKKPEWFVAKPKSAKKPKAASAPKSSKSKAAPLAAQAAAPGMSSSAGSGMDSMSNPSSPPMSPEMAAAGAAKNKKEYTVNIDYIMTGAKGIRVREGNPTSPEAPKGYVTESDGEDMPEEAAQNEDASENENGSEPASPRSPRSELQPGKSWRKNVRRKLKQIFFCF